MNDELLRLFSRALVLLTQGIVEELRRALDVEVDPGTFYLASLVHVLHRESGMSTKNVFAALAAEKDKIMEDVRMLREEVR